MSSLTEYEFDSLEFREFKINEKKNKIFEHISFSDLRLDKNES